MIRLLSSKFFVMLVTTISLIFVAVPVKASTIPCLPPFGVGVSDSLVVCMPKALDQFVVATQESPEKLFYLTTGQIPSSNLVTNAPLTYLTDGTGPSSKVSDIFGVFAIPTEHESEGSKGYDYLSWFSSENSSRSSGCSIWDSNCQKNEDDKGEVKYVLGFISDPLGDAFQDFCAAPKDYWGEASKTSSPCVSGGPERGATVSLARYLKEGTGSFISDTEVPEPAATGLPCGLAALALCAWKRRKMA